jgi:pyridoxine 5-phosphate synthase
MTKLSVNLNKVATVRNARGGSEPDVVTAARICLEAGAAGITVHPRPDGRHIRYADVRDLSRLLEQFPGAELNVEGYPLPSFLELVMEVEPAQCTLVPDPPEALTSSFGWDVPRHAALLRPTLRQFAAGGIRSSVFLEPEPDQVRACAELGVDRIELYTEPYARAYERDDRDEVLAVYARAAERAADLGLGVNAGHDLSLANLGLFCANVPGVLEVSIGHALISYALEVGLPSAVRAYLDVLDPRARAA